MIENLQKEQFSRAYVHAVASRAGLAWIEPRPDQDSVDVTLRADRLQLAEMLRGSGRASDAVRKGPLTIDLQLKATAVAGVLEEHHVKYPLDVHNYNDLRLDLAARQSPILLVVLVLPENGDTWLEQTDEAMTIRRCAYYLSLCGWPESKNQKSVTVPIPRANRFTATALTNMLVRTACGESPCQ